MRLSKEILEAAPPKSMLLAYGEVYVKRRTLWSRKHWRESITSWTIAVFYELDFMLEPVAEDEL